MTGVKTESWLSSVRISSHFVRFKLVEERSVGSEDVEAVGSRLGHVVSVSALFISFIEPWKPDEPDPHHRREKEEAGPPPFRFLSINRVHVVRVRHDRSYVE